jgi:hypothetical protein
MRVGKRSLEVKGKERGKVACKDSRRKLTHLDHLPSKLIHGTIDTDRGDEGSTSHLRGRWRG